MIEQVIHVYFVPGLAANKDIFKNIHLPEDRFRLHFMEWLIPHKNEPIADYARRMADCIEPAANIVLAGVSFGGVVAQEMSAFLHLKKLIIISSVKSRHELPRRLKLACKTRAYKLVPTRSILSATDLTKFAIGHKTKRHLDRYQKYLSVRDAGYLDWAIENMVCWKRAEPLPKVVHIHGDKDPVFPIQNIDNCRIVPGGTHIMILDKTKWLNQHLPEIIDEVIH